MLIYGAAARTDGLGCAVSGIRTGTDKLSFERKITEVTGRKLHTTKREVRGRINISKTRDHGRGKKNYISLPWLC